MHCSKMCGSRLGAPSTVLNALTFSLSLSLSLSLSVFESKRVPLFNVVFVSRAFAAPCFFNMQNAKRRQYEGEIRRTSCVDRSSETSKDAAGVTEARRTTRRRMGDEGNRLTSDRGPYRNGDDSSTRVSG